MIEELISLANDLDSKGLHKEADALDAIIKEAGFMDFLGFMLPEKSKAPEPKKNPHEIAVDRLDSQINLIKRKIRHLSQAGFDLTEDSQNEAEIVELRGKLSLLEKRRDNLLEEYYHMMIPK